MKDNFFIKIESFHSEDKGTIENVNFKYMKFIISSYSFYLLIIIIGIPFAG